MNQLRRKGSIIHCHHVSSAVSKACSPGGAESYLTLIVFPVPYDRKMWCIANLRPEDDERGYFDRKLILHSVLMVITSELKFDTSMLFLVWLCRAESQRSVTIRQN